MYHASQHPVIWLGLYRDLEGTLSACDTCNLNAKLNPKLPPRPIADPEYPFQMISLEYFNIKGKQWLVLVDRYSGWFGLRYLAWSCQRGWKRQFPPQWREFPPLGRPQT